MEIKHIIKLSSGKTIELSEQEYQEIIDSFKSVEYVPSQPYYQQYPSYTGTSSPWLGIYPPTHTADTLIIDSDPEYSKTVDKHFWKLA